MYRYKYVLPCVTLCETLTSASNTNKILPLGSGCRVPCIVCHSPWAIPDFFSGSSITYVRTLFGGEEACRSGRRRRGYDGRRPLYSAPAEACVEATRKGLFEEDRGVLINTLAGTSARAILHAALLLLCSKCTLRPPQLTYSSVVSLYSRGEADAGGAGSGRGRSAPPESARSLALLKMKTSPI